jgi:hypothetical protein
MRRSLHPLRTRFFVIAVVLLALLSLPLLAPHPGEADTTYKVPTANPSFSNGSLVSGSYVNVQTADNTYMGVRESGLLFWWYLDMSWESWQTFNEASRSQVLDIVVDLEGYQSDAAESWYAQFYNFNTGGYDSTWYSLGSFPTSPDGTAQIRVGDAVRARAFVSATGQFRLRIADAGVATGGLEWTRTTLYIDLLRASFIYDVRRPVSNITAPLNGEYTNATAYTIRGTSSDPGPDPSGVASVAVSTNGGGSWNPATPAAPGDYSTWSYAWNPIPAEGTYTIRSRATDAVGNVETPGAGVQLIVDWTPPRVSSTSPLNGAINVGVGSNVQATFLEMYNIQASTVNATTFTLTDELGTPIAGAISYDPVSKTATFDPAADLFYGYNYTATLTTGITDLAGNPLAANYAWTFRTADILTMSLLDTYNRDGTPGGGSVSFGTIDPDNSPFVVGGGSPPYAVRLGVLSSTNWNILVKATSDLTDVSSLPPLTIPIAQLQWRLTGGTAWTPFTLLDTGVFSPARSRTPQPAGSEVPFDLRLDLNWEDTPGNYSTTIVFTLMEQP